MKLNVEYLKSFVDLNINSNELRSLLASIGIEVDSFEKVEGDDVFEVEITPNRPDWLSHIGIAREIKAKLPELNYKYPELDKIKINISNKENFDIIIEDKNDCSRYTGLIIRGVKVKESDEELKRLLVTLGLRPINNIVDISNVVLMTLGHPIHVFDLNKLEGNKIVVRRARNNEKIVLLDETELKLSENDLVIADENQPVALAGVMGGLDSGVSDSTVDILIESAFFNPVVIRKTARNYGIKTDASYRFERGADREITIDAIKLFVKILMNYEKDLNMTYFNDNYPDKLISKKIILPKGYVSEFSGIDIDDKVAKIILNNLGFKVDDKGDYFDVFVPSFRVDIYGKQDIVEEVVRIFGYDKLDSVLPSVVNVDIADFKERETIIDIENYLISNGFNEAINYVFNSEKDNSYYGIDDKDFVRIKNPLGADFSVLRVSLLSNLLKNASNNFNQFFQSIRLFERGKIFYREGDKIEEIDKFSIIASGEYIKKNWNLKCGNQMDFSIFKSIILNMIKRMHSEYSLKSRDINFIKEGSGFDILINNVKCGFIGEVKDSILKDYDIDKKLFYAEFDTENLIDAFEQKGFKQWSKYPFSKRDFSFLIDKNLKYSELEEVIEKNRPDSLESYELIDIYEGKNIPGDKKNFVMSFTYRDKNRTLSSEEVNEIHEKFKKILIEKLNLIHR